MAGPAGDVESDRAGDEGEYHHSRNLKKKIAVGRITLSESNKNWGDEKTKLRKNALNPAAWCFTDEDAVELIRRCRGKSVEEPHRFVFHIPDHPLRAVADQHQSRTAMVGSRMICRTGS